jgi:hypothetical protein
MSRDADIRIISIPDEETVPIWMASCSGCPCQEGLRRAIELNRGMRERAASDQHLAPLRELEGWQAAIG